MTTLSLRRPITDLLSTDVGPVLVSELPPALPARPSFAARTWTTVRARHQARAFERALRSAAPGETGDLLAAHRRA